MSHDYSLRSNPPSNFPTRDNLVLETPIVISTISEGEASNGVGKQIEALTKQMAVDRQHLSVKIDILTDTVHDFNNQQCSHHVAITCLELGKPPSTLESPGKPSVGLLLKPTGPPPVGLEKKRSRLVSRALCLARQKK